MRAVVQRVTRASVAVDAGVIASCGRGLVVLVGGGREDTSESAIRLAGKIARLRVFENEDGLASDVEQRAAFMEVELVNDGPVTIILDV